MHTQLHAQHCIPCMSAKPACLSCVYAKPAYPTRMYALHMCTSYTSSPCTHPLLPGALLSLPLPQLFGKVIIINNERAGRGEAPMEAPTRHFLGLIPFFKPVSMCSIRGSFLPFILSPPLGAAPEPGFDFLPLFLQPPLGLRKGHGSPHIPLPLGALAAGLPDPNGAVCSPRYMP